MNQVRYSDTRAHHPFPYKNTPVLGPWRFERFMKLFLGTVLRGYFYREKDGAAGELRTFVKVVGDFLFIWVSPSRRPHQFYLFKITRKNSQAQ